MWKFIVDVVHDFVSSLQPDVGRGFLHVSNMFLFFLILQKSPNFIMSGVSTRVNTQPRVTKILRRAIMLKNLLTLFAIKTFDRFRGLYHVPDSHEEM